MINILMIAILAVMAVVSSARPESQVVPATAAALHVSRAESAYETAANQVVLVQPYLKPVLHIQLGDFDLYMKLKWGAKYAHGSGVVVDKNSILTAAHVVKGTSIARIETLDGRVMRAVVVARNEQKDLAILRVIGRNLDIRPVKLGKSPSVGDTVFSVGNPLFFRSFVAIGNVGSLRGGMFATTTVVNPGTSGGGLFSMHGELLGICQSLVTPSPMPAFAGHALFSPYSVMVDYLEAYKDVLL